MKLFQRLLVAPAALGLMAPVAVNADTFSSTTTLGGSAFFTTGSVENGTGDTEEELYTQYAYSLNMNSSFTGKDLLVIGMEAGNASGPLALMDSAVSTTGVNQGNAVAVHSAFYTFPVGDLAVTAGAILKQDDIVGATTSQYSDTFRLGAMPFSLAGNEHGPGAGFTYDFANSGWVASISYVADDGSASTTGINSDKGNDVTTFTLGYNSDGWGAGVVTAGHDGDVGTTGYGTFGVGGYWSPESIPATLSIAYDSTNPETGWDQKDVFVGFDYELNNGTLHIAWNSRSNEDALDISDSKGLELAYSWNVNDNVTITPGFFTVGETTSDEEDTGVVVETAFKF